MNRQAIEQAPSAASEAADIRLTNHEWSALMRIRPGAFAAFERYLHANRLDWHEWADA
jgi:hypothetical protein